MADLSSDAQSKRPTLTASRRPPDFPLVADFENILLQRNIDVQRLLSREISLRNELGQQKAHKRLEEGFSRQTLGTMDRVKAISIFAYQPDVKQQP
ncbi:hypothetical protein T265_00106 [Opisthorchis viverrini]|uniref:Uncharacterized protein n=2 Tax=Opisthorchis viverrini TaxID=6198 RepID=A0A075A7B7_OPIVI|nr:hypothetical protein T265_00106 [Opisthorchis viverrini]KER34257.1 hypothetical protein T265_00106 [Opisthorchis viverrini]